MAYNTNPVFAKEPQIEWANDVTVANTTKDLTTGTIYLVFTGAAGEGSFLEKLRLRHRGTNVVTAIRVFINNGLTTGTAVNNVLYDEITLPANTLSEVAASPVLEIPMRLAIPAGYRVYVTLATDVAAGFDVTGVGGKFTA